MSQADPHNLLALCPRAATAGTLAYMVHSENGRLPVSRFKGENAERRTIGPCGIDKFIFFYSYIAHFKNIIAAEISGIYPAAKPGVRKIDNMGKHPGKKRFRAIG